jgi:hypothetical protein
MDTYVISDLHIGAGPLDDCDAGCEDALVAFFDTLAGRAAHGPLELILNGDTFDFVQAEPWRGADLEAAAPDGVQLCFTEELSDQKARSIIGAHSRFFDALGRLRATPQVRLTILPGNHDSDLFWPSVRGVIDERLGPRGATHWHLERQYLPPAAPWVLIEHGHQYDEVNAFFYPQADPRVEFWSAYRPPILTARDGRQRLLACVGTRFLLRFLNELDYRYPFVDNIKPFGRFLSIFASSANQLRGGTGRAALSALAFARFVSVEAVVARDNLMSLSATGEDLGGRPRPPRRLVRLRARNSGRTRAVARFRARPSRRVG